MDLLRETTTFDEWRTSRDSAEPSFAEFDDLAARYHLEHSVTLTAFSDRGVPTRVPDAHIVDALARAWVPGLDEAGLMRPGFGTVAIAVEHTECDLCQWGAARYETRLDSRGAVVVLCQQCAEAKADPLLGPGHSVLLLHQQELSDEILDVVLPHMPADAQASWRQRFDDRWRHFRRWGFTGDVDADSVFAVIGEFQVSLETTPYDALLATERAAGGRGMFLPGGGETLIPLVHDDLDAREVLVWLLWGRSSHPVAREVAGRFLGVPAEERDARAREALERDGHEPYIRVGDDYLCHNADWRQARNAARASQDRGLVKRLAAQHRDVSIRLDAVANDALDAEDLLDLAAVGDELLAHALLKRSDLPADGTERVVTTLRLAGRMPHWSMRLALVRPDFPEHALRSVVTRLADDGTDARIDLAADMHDAPAHRRDEVHLQLLEGARRIPSSCGLVEAVIGDVPERREWLLGAGQPWKIRQLVEYYDEERIEAHAAEVPAQPLSLEGGPAKLSAAAVAARIRRWWIRDAFEGPALRASDLGDALEMCRLVRHAATLRIHTPYDFGDGVPLELTQRVRMADHLADLSQGAVRNIEFRFDRKPRTTTRRRSSDLDIFEPGDALWPEHLDAAASLASAIRRECATESLPVLMSLALAGVSRHRLWIAAFDEEARRAVGSTPGAAASLKIAVGRIQGRRRYDEALSVLLADPSTDLIALAEAAMARDA